MPTAEGARDGSPLRSRAFGRAQEVIRAAVPGRRLRLALAVAELERLGASRPLRILDAGCGEGLLARTTGVRHPDWSVVGVDLSFEALRRGQQSCARSGNAPCFVQADLTRPIAAAAVDAVVSLEALEEIPDDDAALGTMVAALRPGGWLIMQVPTADWTPVLPGGERTWRLEVRHGYSRAVLAQWLADHDLDVREIRPTFHRLAALAEDLRGAARRRSTRVQLMLTPLHVGAVVAERYGLRLGRPRAWFVVAQKR